MKTESFKVTQGSEVVATVKFTERPGLGYSARLDMATDNLEEALRPYGVGDTPWAATDSLMAHPRVQPLADAVDAARRQALTVN